jgi:hypothetical protein
MGAVTAYALRYRLAYDAGMVTSVLNVFLRAVFADLRRRARDYGIERAQCGAVTFVQRFGSALNCTIRFHTLVLDGVYAPKDRDAPEFFPLRAPKTSDVQKVVETVASCVSALMKRRGLSEGDGEDSDPLLREEDGRLSRIRLSEKGSRCRPRKAASPLG